MLLRIFTVEEIETEIFKGKKENKIFRKSLNFLFRSSTNIS